MRCQVFHVCAPVRDCVTVTHTDCTVYPLNGLRTSPGMLTVTACARRVKQESNCSFFEQFFSRGFFRGSCDINSGMSSKHFCRDLRGFDVGGK